MTVGNCKYLFMCKHGVHNHKQTVEKIERFGSPNDSDEFLVSENDSQENSGKDNTKDEMHAIYKEWKGEGYKFVAYSANVNYIAKPLTQISLKLVKLFQHNFRTCFTCLWPNFYYQFTNSFLQ
jgi:hypothetical protein